MIEMVKVTLTRNKQTILDDLSLQIPDHRMFGIFGSDHQSRSMILKMAAGLEEPERGRVTVDGEPVYERRSNTYLKTGYLPDHIGLYSQLKLEEYYEMILSLYRIYGRNRIVRMEEVSSRLNLTAYMDRYLDETPQEMYPFLGLGAAILHEPDWLILNEPFESLNVAGRERMIEILRDLYDEGISFLINTQVFGELTGFLTDIAVIEDGRVMVSGSIEEVMAREMEVCPVRMQVIDGMEEALKVLKESPVVERVTVTDHDVILRFSGDEREEAQLLSQITAAGALVRNYHRDQVNLEDILRR